MSKKNKIFFSTLIFFSGVSFGCFAGPAAAQAPQQEIESFFSSLRSMEFPVTDPAQHARTVELADAALDVKSLGEKALGSHWADFSHDQQEVFVDVLRKLIENIAYPRAHKFLDAQTITYQTPKSIDRGVELSSSLTAQETGLQVPVVYNLYEDNGRWKVYDIFLDGISMTEDLQFQFDKVIQDSGIFGLIEQMGARLTRAQTENSGRS